MTTRCHVSLDDGMPHSHMYTMPCLSLACITGTRWHDYTMPCLTRRWHASLTHVHDAMPLADHNGMHHWHTMACMTTMHAGVLPTCLRCMSRPCTCLRCMSRPHAHSCYACHSHMHMPLTATHVLPTCLAILPWSGEMRARGDEGD